MSFKGLGVILLTIALCSCGKPAFDTSFYKQSEIFDLISNQDIQSVDSADVGANFIAGSAMVLMQPITGGLLKSAQVAKLSLDAVAGDFDFVSLAKCYLKAKNNNQIKPIYIGKATAQNIENNYKTLVFQIETQANLNDLISSTYYFFIEIYGAKPSTETKVQANVVLNARVEL